MIITADRIIIGDGKTVLKDSGVCIDNGNILKVGPIEEIMTAYKEHEVIAYGDATILPGLIDMHVHTGNIQMKPDISRYSPFLISLFAHDVLKKSFEKGVTTVRDVGSQPGLFGALKAAVEKKYIEVPRIFSCESSICMTGGHAWDLPGDVVIEVDGAQEIRKAIRKNIREGADWIKVMDSHRTFTPEYTQEELDVAVDECHRVGKKVAVHAGAQPSIEMCIQAGFDTIEHGTHLTVEQAIEMREKGIAWVPTIIAYYYVKEGYEKILGVTSGRDYDFIKDACDVYRENFKKLMDTGVKILAGTDMVIDGAPVTPIAQELNYMVEFGMDCLPAIQTATQNAAEVLGLGDQLGLVREGYIADLLVVKGDPSVDIKSLEKVQSVYFSGKQVFSSLA